MDKPEQEWIALYRQGDVEALGKLVEHYRRPLYGFILKMTEGADDAEEVFQEVWFRAIKHLNKYRQKHFLSWLFRIAHNLIIDRARKAKPLVDIQGATEDGVDAIESRVAGPGIGPAAETAGHDLGAHIAAAVKKLPLQQKEVFVMRTEGDLPFKEIARIQKTSVNTALARMHYALVKLREQLRDDYEALTGAAR